MENIINEKLQKVELLELVSTKLRDRGPSTKRGNGRTAARKQAADPQRDEEFRQAAYAPALGRTAVIFSFERSREIQAE